MRSQVSCIATGRCPNSDTLLGPLLSIFDDQNKIVKELFCCTNKCKQPVCFLLAVENKITSCYTYIHAYIHKYVQYIHMQK